VVRDIHVGDTNWDGKALKARMVFGAPDQETLAPPATALERCYALAIALSAMLDRLSGLANGTDPLVCP